jgi:AraC-like DNA-binding protein
MIKIFEPHEFIRSTSEGYRYCVTIDADFLLTACSSRSNLLNIFSKKNPNYPFGHVNEDILQQYLDIANRYFQIIIKPGYDIYEKAILYELLATMYNRFYSESVIDNNDIMDLTVIVKLIQYINSNLNKQLSLDELADVIHFSKFYLCKQFKRITGYTLKKYIIGKRIHKAKLMLMDNIPISNISLELGFNNYSHFYKTFLQTEGISPSDYRIQLNKDHS